MSVRQEIPVLARLAAPVIMSNLGMMLMGVVDVVMVGQLGPEALAAASLGFLWVFGTLMPATGILHGIDPVVTQAHGAGDGPRAGLALQRALVLCLPLTLLVLVAWQFADAALRLAGQSPELSATAHEYAAAQGWSVLPLLAHWALRQYLAGRGIVAPAMWVAWAANVVNVVANWILIFGNLGFEAQGVVGAGIATGLSRTFMAAALLAWVVLRRLHAGAWPRWSRRVMEARGLWEILRHGLPSGGQMALEVWGFSATGLLAGLLGAGHLAAHQIALSLASTSFMVPLGISVAAATRVGNLTGAGDEREARIAARAALLMGAAVMGVSALLFLLFRSVLPRAYGVDEATVALAAAVLPVAAAFQIFDGIQVVGCGVLRGRGDTQPAFWFNLIGYYVLGLPCAALLAFTFDMGLAGLWWGLMIGLATVAILLTARILRRH